MNNDLISRSELKARMMKAFGCEGATKYGNKNAEQQARSYSTLMLYEIADTVEDCIDNAPTVVVPENEVNCVLTMFGKCSYNETGCFDCEIKDKIRKALNERPQGEWILQYRNLSGEFYTCSQCERMILVEPEQSLSDYPFCHCGAKMRKGGDEE